MADGPSEPTSEQDAAESPGASESPDAAAPAEPQHRPTPRPGVSAVSRARRIGGRPQRGETDDALAGGTAATSATTDGDATTAVDGETEATAADRPAVSTRKRTRQRAAAGTGTDDATTPASRTSSTPVELPGWVRWAPAAILTAGVIAMAIVVFLASNGVWRNKPSVTAEREQVLGAAKNCFVAVSTYKYTDIAAYKRHGLACATGRFKTQFGSAVDGLIKPQAPKLKATQTAQVNRGGLQSVVDGQWTIVIYGQVNVVNTSTPKGRLDPLGAVVRMQRSHGKWLIAKLDLIDGSGTS